MGLRRLRQQPDLRLQHRQRRRATGSSSARTRSTTRRAAAPASAGSTPARPTSSSRLEDDPMTAVDESHYIQLARTEQEAIDGVEIDLLTPDEQQATTSSSRGSPARPDRQSGADRAADAALLAVSSADYTYDQRSPLRRREPPRRQDHAHPDGRRVQPVRARPGRQLLRARPRRQRRRRRGRGRQPVLA